MNSFSHNMHQLKDKVNINWFKCSFTKILYFTLLFRAFSILTEPVTSSVTKAFLKMPKFRKKKFFLRLKLDRQPRISQVYPFLCLEFLKSKNYFFLSPLLPMVPVPSRAARVATKVPLESCFNQLNDESSRAALSSTKITTISVCYKNCTKFFQWR